MYQKLVPDHCFESFSEITPAFLAQIGIKGLVLDIDNTLVPYELDRPTEDVLAWLSSLNEAGIPYAFVSNNHEKRVATFCEGMDVFYSFDSCKPFRGALKRAKEWLGLESSEICAIGDQIFTDVYGAKRMGFCAVLLPPIKDKRDPFTRFKRWLERPSHRAYRKRLEKQSEKQP